MIQDVYAPNYSLSIFEGQGVKHALGFGVVTRVEQKGLKRVMVRFESGAELVCESANLRPALMSESELEFERTKPYPLLEAEGDVSHYEEEAEDEADPEADGIHTGEAPQPDESEHAS